MGFDDIDRVYMSMREGERKSGVEKIKAKLSEIEKRIQERKESKSEELKANLDEGDIFTLSEIRTRHNKKLKKLREEKRNLEQKLSKYESNDSDD